MFTEFSISRLLYTTSHLSHFVSLPIVFHFSIIHNCICLVISQIIRWSCSHKHWHSRRNKSARNGWLHLIYHLPIRKKPASIVRIVRRLYRISKQKLSVCMTASLSQSMSSSLIKYGICDNNNIKPTLHQRPGNMRNIQRLK